MNNYDKKESEKEEKNPWYQQQLDNQPGRKIHNLLEMEVPDIETGLQGKLVSWYRVNLLQHNVVKRNDTVGSNRNGK